MRRSFARTPDFLVHSLVSPLVSLYTASAGVFDNQCTTMVSRGEIDDWRGLSVYNDS